MHDPRSETVWGRDEGMCQAGEKSSVRAQLSTEAWLPQDWGGPSAAPAPPLGAEGPEACARLGLNCGTQPAKGRQRTVLPAPRGSTGRPAGGRACGNPDSDQRHKPCRSRADAPRCPHPEPGRGQAVSIPGSPEAGQLGVVPEALWCVPLLPSPTGYHGEGQASMPGGVFVRW